MPERERLTNEMDALEKRLTAQLTHAPVDDAFWLVFDRKRKAIEMGVGPADLEFVRNRINGILAAHHLAAGGHGRRC
ncbi:MAG: hypothetical protein ABI411_20720 [Tahibacter sp.]